ncbi:MAG: bifunctional metallophosphatase/5'-nucleotidase [Myxococcales bacterium]|nr:bifunctional metallophosphatase/5'-nucleotidase [Myxococcales bacterium]
MRFAAIGIALALCSPSCVVQRENPKIEGQTIRVTFLHTTDIHSRLIPYDMIPLATDQRLGLLIENKPYGGIAKLAYLMKRERSRSSRVVHIDSGDCFQGAPIFNAFLGEIEIRSMSQLGPDAVVIGNHEFDEGLSNLVKQYQKWGNYPLLAANYDYYDDNPLKVASKPFTIINKDGFKIGVIGIANFSSISSITDIGNSLKIWPLEIKETVQDYIDILRPQVDLIIATSHAGLGEDEETIQQTRGLDAVLGGHLHIVLMPPKVIKDLDGRDVILSHSGAFAKYLGRLDVVVRDGEIIQHKYQLFPIDKSVPEDPQMMELIEPYRLVLNQKIDLRSVFGYSSKRIPRFGFNGGDSDLGNFVAEAIRQLARADFAITNSLGIRTDFNQGPLTLDQLFNVFPFNNTVTTLYISGSQIKELFDFVTRRSAGRGCVTQVQVSGIRFTMNCDADPPVSQDIVLTSCTEPAFDDPNNCKETPLDPYAIYELATNDYIAGGGSGFTILRSNNTQVDTGISLRDAVLEKILRSQKCVDECKTKDGNIVIGGCLTYEGCVDTVSTFRDQFCKNVDQTSPGQTFKNNICPVDGLDCTRNDDCVDGVKRCAAGNCTRCKGAADCTVDGEECLDGFCLVPDSVCLFGRCRNRCKQEADCPGSNKVTPSQSLCVDEGRCLPKFGQHCIDDAGCHDPWRMCFGKDGRFCLFDSDCADGTSCRRNLCVPTLPATCTTSADCGGGTCTRGFCNAFTACGSDADCQADGAGSVCISGLCSKPCGLCSADADCPAGHRCLENRCIVPLATCVAQRCRQLCDNEDDCIGNTSCVFPTCQGDSCPKSTKVCEPQSCSDTVGLEEACRLNNLNLAQEQCLILACPRSGVDGRIKRILPKNTKDRPSDPQIDDPEG